MWADEHIIADGHSIANEREGLYLAPFTDTNQVTDPHMGMDGGILPNMGSLDVR
jgi:hypothetical protein